MAGRAWRAALFKTRIWGFPALALSAEEALVVGAPALGSFSEGASAAGGGSAAGSASDASSISGSGDSFEGAKRSKSRIEEPQDVKKTQGKPARHGAQR